MTKTQTTNFDNEMKALAQSVYKKNEEFVPKDWIKVSEYDKKSGFHGEAFCKNGKVVIAMRGTDEKWKDLVKEDIGHLLIKRLPNQYTDAQKFYEKVKKDFPDQEIIFTGHSLGGSLAQLMSSKTGYETVTFNAYGVAGLLQGNISDKLLLFTKAQTAWEDYYKKEKDFINKNIAQKDGDIHTAIAIGDLYELTKQIALSLKSNLMQLSE